MQVLVIKLCKQHSGDCWSPQVFAVLDLWPFCKSRSIFEWERVGIHALIRDTCHLILWRSWNSLQVKIENKLIDGSRERRANKSNKKPTKSGHKQIDTRWSSFLKPSRLNHSFSQNILRGNILQKLWKLLMPIFSRNSRRDRFFYIIIVSLFARIKHARRRRKNLLFKDEFVCIFTCVVIAIII